jgi:hypothetical protein
MEPERGVPTHRSAARQIQAMSSLSQDAARVGHRVGRLRPDSMSWVHSWGLSSASVYR